MQDATARVAGADQVHFNRALRVNGHEAPTAAQTSATTALRRANMRAALSITEPYLPSQEAYAPHRGHDLRYLNRTALINR